jgi:hypothetical protein
MRAFSPKRLFLSIDDATDSGFAQAADPQQPNTADLQKRFTIRRSWNDRMNACSEFSAV